MIRINFIADEIAKEKRAKIRRFVLIGYASFWILSIGYIFARYKSERSEVITDQQKVEEYKEKIEQISPAFQKAVRLYGERNAHKKELAKVFGNSMEPSFVIESLDNLAESLPTNFWLQKLHIASDKGKKADKKKTKGSKIMLISGNVLLDLAAEDKEQVKRLQMTLGKRKPYSRAESYLDLDKMKVTKLGERYFHNFSLQFSWPNIYL
ncbi:hypothetical protein MJD09_17995 [bacterium]|nr:hypothetical protein [bacterium]